MLLVCCLEMVVLRNGMFKPFLNLFVHLESIKIYTRVDVRILYTLIYMHLVVPCIEEPVRKEHE